MRFLECPVSLIWQAMPFIVSLISPCETVVGTFDPRTLLASPSSHLIDFRTIPIPELQEFTIEINWTANFTGIIHGIAGWFDIGFVPPPGTPSPVAFALTTAPQAERTHWHQIRLLLREPLAVNALQTVRGWLHMKVNDMRSYTMEAELVIGDEPLSSPSNTTPRDRSTTRRRETWQLQDQTYYYGYDPALPNNQDYQPEYSCLVGSFSPLVWSVMANLTCSFSVCPGNGSWCR